MYKKTFRNLIKKVWSEDLFKTGHKFYLHIDLTRVDENIYVQGKCF